MPVGCVSRTVLTKREQEVLTFLLSGCWQAKEIAKRLGVTPRTVIFHRANLWRKLRAGAKLCCARCGAEWGTPMGHDA